MAGSNGRPEWVERGKIGGIDGLRGCAILGVLITHAAHVFLVDESDVLAPAADFLGRLGVQIFFAISGFLITLLLLREYDRAGSISLRGFYRRRTLRIIPAYVCYLTAIFAAAGAGWITIDATSSAAALTYTMDFVPRPSLPTEHIWTLSLEEQYYLIWPLAFATLGPRGAFRGLLAFLIATPLLRPAVESMLLSAGAHPTRIFSSTTIAAGCLFAFVVWDRRAWPRLGRVRLPALLDHPALVWLGTLSYSLYLWQQPILMNNGWNDRLPFAARVVLTFASAAGSYHLIERPFLRLKERAANRAGAAVAVGGVPSL